MRMTTAVAAALLAGLAGPALVERGTYSDAPSFRPTRYSGRTPPAAMAQHNRSNRRAKNKAARKSRKANRK